MSSLYGAIATPARRPRVPPVPRDRAAALLRLLWIEIRRSQGIWLVPLMVCLGLFASLNYSNEGVVFWEDLNNRTVQTYTVIGPLAAALAAWLAGRNRRQRLQGLASTMPGTGFQRDLLTWLTASFWGAVGYGIVFGWLGWQGFWQATWGGPEPLLLLTGLLAIMLFAAIGVGIGRFVNSRFAALLALIVTFMLTIGSDAFKVSEGMDGYRQPLKLLLPWGLVSDGYPHVFYGSFAPVVPEMVVWLIGLIGVVLTILALLRRPAGISVAMLAVSIVVAGAGAGNLVRPGSEPWSGTAGQPVAFEWSCRSVAEVEVCLHPAWNTVLDGVSTTVATMIEPVAGLDGVPTRWVQGSPLRPEPGEGVLWQIQPEALAWAVADVLFPYGANGDYVQMRPASQLVILSWLLARGETGEMAGFWDGWPFGWPLEVPFAGSSGDGDDWFQPDEAALAAITPAFQAAVDRFSALSPDEQRVWLEANWDALRAGEIALDEMP